MSMASSRPPRKKKTARRAYRPDARRRILDAATRIIYAEGLSAATVDRILEDSSAHRASYYAHFPDRAGLTEAYIQNKGDELFEMTSALMDRHPEPERFLRAWIRVMLAGIRTGQYHGCAFANLAAQGAAGEPLRETFLRWQELFSAYFRRGRGGSKAAADRLAGECLLIYEGGVAMFRVTGDAAYVKKIPELILPRLES